MNDMAVFNRKKTDGGYVKSRYKLGLALSGGGTRGIAHLGVLKAFAEQKIRFDCVAGTSVGSLVGAMYCAQIDLDELISETKTLTRKELVNKRFAFGSNSANIQKLADKFLQGKTFEELDIPFACVAVDIASGNEVVLDSGDVSLAVAASCAVPALFTPVRYSDMLLVDGGLLNNMPADVCRQMGADVVVGVDLNHARGKGTSSKRLLDTLVATWNITTKSTMYKGQLNSDIVVEPELTDYKNTSLKNVDERIQAGYTAATAVMDELKRLLQLKY